MSIDNKYSKKKELWEFIIPEPFSIDPILREEDLIQTMSNFSSQEEMNGFLFECLAPPEKRILLSASEYEIFNEGIFNIENENISIDLVKDEQKFVIVVKNEDNEILGRGELSKVGKKRTTKEAKEIFSNDMQGFIEKYEEGMAKIESLVFHAQSLQNNLLKNQESEENN
jgi:hypothetical protein